MKKIGAICLFLCLFEGELLSAQYQITELKGLPACDSTRAFINDSGQIAATVFLTGWRAGTWDAVNGFNYICDVESYAFGLNNRGQIAGSYGAAQKAVVWSGGAVTNILPGDLESKAMGINDNGTVAGTKCVDGLGYAFTWSNGVVTELGQGRAKAINSKGQVAGTTYFGNTRHAVVWDNSTVIDLGAFAYFTPITINDMSDVLITDGQESFIWSNGSVVQLGKCEVFGMNNLGQVVGLKENSEGWWTAYLWDKSGTAADLNTIIPENSGWQKLTCAIAINNSGQIVGMGIMDDGTYATYLLTPIPEPGTVLLLGFGAVWMRRKKEKHLLTENR
jgi:probable HAF family extracellular repeat protein